MHHRRTNSVAAIAAIHTMSKATVALNEHTRHHPRVFILLIHLPSHKRIIHPNQLTIHLLLRNRQNGGIYWMSIDRAQRGHSVESKISKSATFRLSDGGYGCSVTKIRVEQVPQCLSILHMLPNLGRGP